MDYLDVYACSAIVGQRAPRITGRLTCPMVQICSSILFIRPGHRHCEEQNEVSAELAMWLVLREEEAKSALRREMLSRYTWSWKECEF